MEYSSGTGFVFSSDEGDLFGCFHGMMPGDEAAGTVKIKNTGTEPAKIYMRVDTDDTFEKMSEYVSIDVTAGKDGKKVPVGRLSGGSDRATCIGLFEPGDEATISAEIRISKYMGNEFSDISDVVKWVFTAEENGKIFQSTDKASTGRTERKEYSETDVGIPYTGSHKSAVMTGAALLAIVVQGTVAVCIFRKQRGETQSDQQRN